MLGLQRVGHDSVADQQQQQKLEKNWYSLWPLKLWPLPGVAAVMGDRSLLLEAQTAVQ